MKNNKKSIRTHLDFPTSKLESWLHLNHINLSLNYKNRTRSISIDLDDQQKSNSIDLDSILIRSRIDIALDTHN